MRNVFRKHVSDELYATTTRRVGDNIWEGKRLGLGVFELRVREKASFGHNFMSVLR